MTHRLVSELGGMIAVDATGGRGAAVTVTLPRNIARERRDAA
jgi:signal transduction histidine kinase